MLVERIAEYLSSRGMGVCDGEREVVLTHPLGLPLPLDLLVAGSGGTVGLLALPPAATLRDDAGEWILDGLCFLPSLGCAMELAAAALREQRGRTPCRVAAVLPVRGPNVALGGDPVVVGLDDSLVSLFDAGDGWRVTRVGRATLPGWRVETLRDASGQHVEYLACRDNDPSRGVATHRLTGFAAERREEVRYRYELLQRLGVHPHITPVAAAWLPGGEVVLEACAWEEALTLGHLLGHVPTTLDERLELLADVAAGLDAAHRHGVVHGNLSPAAVELPAEGARLRHFAVPVPTPWREAACRYRSRELPMLPSSDLYSLGVIATEALIGSAPDGEGEDEMREPGESWLALPPDVVDLLHALCDTDPERRPASAGEVQTRLRAALRVPEPADWQPEIEVGEEDPVFAAGALAGDFRIVRHLGGGGFAHVYEAVHVLQEQVFALKVYHRSVPDSDLVEEFWMLHELEHPHIVRVHWSGHLPDGRAYLALECLAGESLVGVAAGERELTVHEAVAMADQVLAALAALHDPSGRRGRLAGKVLLHRDVKPGNIVQVPGRGFVLIDFNVAREVGRAASFTGTARYTPPDMEDGSQRRWDPSADTFALGVTLYELLCREGPYGDERPAPVAQPRPPTGRAGAPIPSAVAEVMYRAVQPRREARFADATAMRKALCEAVATPAAAPVQRLAAEGNPWVLALRQWLDSPAGRPAPPLLAPLVAEGWPTLAGALAALTAPERHAPCLGCAVREGLVIPYNAATLADPESRRRLERAVTMAEWRERQRLNPPGMLRLAGYLLVRDLDCRELPGRLATLAPMETLRRACWNLADPLPGMPDVPLSGALQRLDWPRWEAPATASEWGSLPLSELPRRTFPGRSPLEEEALGPLWPMTRSGLADRDLLQQAYRLVTRMMGFEAVIPPHEPDGVALFGGLLAGDSDAREELTVLLATLAGQAAPPAESFGWEADGCSVLVGRAGYALPVDLATLERLRRAHDRRLPLAPELRHAVETLVGDGRDGP